MTSRSLKLTSECSCVYSLNLSKVNSLGDEYPSLRERKSRCMFTLSIQREIRQFHAVVGGWAVKEMCKKLDACATVCAISPLKNRGETGPG